MSIQVQQPLQHDIVTDTIQVAGVAGGAFEAGFVARVHEGHDEVIVPFMAGDGIGGHGQFQVEVDVSSASFTLARLFVEVFHVSPRDGEELDTQVVEVLHGPQLVPGYTAYLEHVVRAGDTLWGIAATHYGDGSLYPRLVEANPGTILDPDRIDVGQVVRVPRA